MKTKRFAYTSFMCFALALMNFASAQTPQELQRADKLRIRSWVEPADNIIARQQLKLQIEVATDRWFSGGTRIGHFEVKDAIVLQREKFALNSTRVEEDKTWTSQIWTLVIYPQRGGVFEVPPIPLQVSVSGENFQSVTGQAFTRPFSFVAKVPAQIADKNGWVATNRFEIDESFDKGFDQLQPGDALTRSVTIFARNLPAMMLPQLAPDDIPGIAAYNKPARISDKVNRGDYQAERAEVISYVFEEPGEYLLPAQTFYWWNLESQSVEIIELEQRVLIVGGVTGVNKSDDQPIKVRPVNRIQDLMPLFKKLAVGVCLALLVWLLVSRLRKRNRRTFDPSDNGLSEGALLRKFNQACRENQPEKALGALYQWLDSYQTDSFDGSIRDQLISLNQVELSQLFSRVMGSIYGSGETSQVDLRVFAEKYMLELKRANHSTGVGPTRIGLKLN